MFIFESIAAIAETVANEVVGNVTSGCVAPVRVPRTLIDDIVDNSDSEFLKTMRDLAEVLDPRTY